MRLLKDSLQVDVLKKRGKYAGKPSQNQKQNKEIVKTKTKIKKSSKIYYDTL